MVAWCRNSVLIVLAWFVLSACTGGGGGGASEVAPPAKQGAGEWNQLVWDQDNWK